MNYNILEFETYVRECCTLTTDELFVRLEHYGFRLVHHGSEPYGKQGKLIHNRYAYRPGKFATSPLLVCHADTVRECLEYACDYETMRVVSSELDDRLGIACLLYSLSIGNSLSDCAMLICDNEEIASSTAAQFTDDALDLAGLSSHYPNWLMEFDRHGIDVVTYQYENDTLHSLLESVGMVIGSGTFSDISLMSELGRSGMNVGVGYHREHTLQCYAVLYDTLLQLERANSFCERYGDIVLKYEVPRYEKYSGRSSDRYRWDDWKDDYSYEYARKDVKAVVEPIVSGLWDNPADDDELNELEDCECCDILCHEQDMLDWNDYRVCEQCYADFIQVDVSNIE